MLPNVGSCVNLSDHTLNTYLTAETSLLTKPTLSIAESTSNRARAFDPTNTCSERGMHGPEGTQNKIDGKKVKI